MRPLFTFRLLGIPVRVQAYFLIMAAVFPYSFGRGDPLLFLAAMAIVGLSVLAHELGHALTMRALGYPPWIELVAMGGLAHWPEGADPTARQDLLISAAGPGAAANGGPAAHSLARRPSSHRRMIPRSLSGRLVGAFASPGGGRIGIFIETSRLSVEPGSSAMLTLTLINQGQVVDHFRDQILFVQVGQNGHHHPKLKGVIDLRGRTSLRELVRLVYHAQGVVCSVTALMHLAAAVKVPRQVVIETPTLNHTNLPYANEFTLVPNPAIAGRNLEYYRYDGEGIKGSRAELLQCMASVTPEAVWGVLNEVLDK